MLPYRVLPSEDPGTPDLRSPLRFLLWTGRQQRWLICAGVVFGVIWMLSQAFLWAAVGAAIDHGIAPRHEAALVRWTLVVLGLGAVQGISGAIRHQIAVTNWMTATYRTIQLVGRHVASATTAVTNVVPPGDVAGTVAMDAMRIGGAFDVIPRLIGSIVSWLGVSVILLRTSVTLGLVVLIGVPLLAALTQPLMRPLHERQRVQRDVAGKLAAMGSDTVAGLRILRGVGGEDAFFARYEQTSRLVEEAGVRVSSPQSGLEMGQTLLPALLTAVVTYLGARAVLHGSLHAGQLVAFFGYATFLTTPLRTMIEYVIAGTRALVGARKVIAILEVPRTHLDSASLVPWPQTFVRLHDDVSGVSIEHGSLVGLVTEDERDALDVADRLGRLHPTDVASVDDVPLTSFSVRDVRRHVVVSEIQPHLFSGTLRDVLVTNTAHEDDVLRRILDGASAGDVLDGLDDGLDSVIEERGRSLSGGQRQRLTLARALATDADVLILLEPTSAVDAHTEQRIARSLRSLRAGRTTVVASASPLVLEHVDTVIVVRDGRVRAQGTHAELLSHDPDYRALVLRGNE